MIPTIHKGKLYASEKKKPNPDNYWYNNLLGLFDFDETKYLEALKQWESQLLEVDNVEYKPIKSKKDITKFYMMEVVIIDENWYEIEDIGTIEIEPTTKGHCKITEIKED